MSKPNVDAIFQLTSLQKSLLFHHLTHDFDQGFLQVRCEFEGAMDRDLFQTAWAHVYARHEALRSTFHWENIEKPVQVVRSVVEPELRWTDLSQLGDHEQDAQKAKYLEEDRAQGIDLPSSPLTRIRMFELSDVKHSMVWTCHHMMIDGWSTAVALSDVLTTYNALVASQPINLPAIPSLKTYVASRKSRDRSRAMEFWQDYLREFAPGATFTSEGQSKESPLRTISREFTFDSDSLNEALKRNRTTVGLWFQFVWSVILRAYQGSNDVGIGVTTSGRNIDLPNADRLVGLFMNVVPVRNNYDQDIVLSEALIRMQNEVREGTQFDFVGVDEISEWTDVPVDKLFDSLVVVENFPVDNDGAGQLQMRDFGGGLTTTYPVTLVIIPGSRIKTSIIFDEAKVTSQEVEFFLDSIDLATRMYIADSNLPIRELINDVTAGNVRSPHVSQEQSEIKYTQDDSSTEYVPPRNPTELALTRIWESVFKRQPIGVEDNFFEIGGKSVMAVRLFAQIEQKLGKNMPPVMLVKRPTIALLAEALEGDASKGWSSLVAFRAAGSRPPLICVHAGGGHVFFYNMLAKHLSDDQPVYSLQPKGLDGVAEKHQSIEEMASHYVEEIIEACPEGPIVLLSICYGNAACIEIARQLRTMGREVADILIIDSAPSVLGVEPQPGVKTTINRYVDIVKRADVKALVERVPIVIEGVRKKLDYALAPTQRKNLLDMQESIRVLNRDYTWRPYDGSITMIRSTEMHNRSDKDWHVEHWKKVITGDVRLHVIEGIHHNLFLEPEVQVLAAKVDSVLSELTSVADRT